MTRTDPLEAVAYRLADEMHNPRRTMSPELRETWAMRYLTILHRAELVRRPSDLLVSRIVASVMRRYPIWHVEHDPHYADLERKKMEADVRALLDGKDGGDDSDGNWRDDSDTEPFDPSQAPGELDYLGGEQDSAKRSSRTEGSPSSTVGDHEPPATPCKHCGHERILHDAPSSMAPPCVALPWPGCKCSGYEPSGEDEGWARGDLSNSSTTEE